MRVSDEFVRKTIELITQIYSQPKFEILCESIKENIQVDFSEQSDRIEFPLKLSNFLKDVNNKTTCPVLVEEIFNRLNDGQKALDVAIELKELYDKLPPPSSKNKFIFAYVITGTTARVKSILSEDLLEKIQPPNHDDVCYYWKPFLNSEDRDINIKQLLEDFKNRYGFSQLEVEFLEGRLSGQKLDDIDTNSTNAVVIVDLLALDNENEITARKFDTKKVIGVITPICFDIPSEVRSYMVNKSKDIFRGLHHNLDTYSDSYLFINTAKNSLYQTLKKKLSERLGPNRIGDKTSPINRELRKLTTYF